MEELPDINRRIRELIDIKENRSISKFSEKIGQSHQVISRIFRVDKRLDKFPSVSFSLLRSIKDAYPDVSEHWLEKGVGEMLTTPRGKIAKEATALPFHDDDLEIIKREDGTEFRRLSDENYLMITPLITEYAYGGYTEGWSQPEYIHDLPRHAIVVDKLHFGIYRSFQVKGDSMNNGLLGSIADGYIVTGRRVEQKYWKSKLHIHKYKDFVIVGQEGINVKRIIEHKVEEGIIVCASLNEDKKQYPNFEINLSQVKELYNIISVTEKKG